ncbi:MAG: hypothetical protein KAW81_00315 [Dehalococcoidia bacterium]|nr:hypothetical protein [Dehalococcoidia bacterium]
MSPFDWLIYLDVADNLLGFHAEGYSRSAVSRAYYGVFGEIRDRLEHRGIQFKRENIHREIIEWLKNQADKGIVHIGVELDRLRRERNWADYNSIRTFTRLRAEKSLLKARSMQRSIPVYL